MSTCRGCHSPSVDTSLKGLCAACDPPPIDKPRIKLVDSIWQCFGDGAGGFGPSPAAAWSDWFSDLPLYGTERGRHMALFRKVFRDRYART